MNYERGHQLISTALAWLDRSCAVVPAMPRSKEVRLAWGNYKFGLPTQKQIEFWFKSGVMNLALVCGTGGIVVLDFDDQAKYLTWSEKAGELAMTYNESTGRGMHLFYQVDYPYTRRFHECEVLGLGHLCLLSPSVHPDGHIYLPAAGQSEIKQVTTKLLFSFLSEQAVTERAANPPLTKKEYPGRGYGDLVSRIKRSFSLFGYAGSLTLLYAGPAGTWYGSCPLHVDHHPSFWVNERLGIWKCYSSSCRGSAGGDVINLYALVRGLSVREAISELARRVL